MKTPKPKNALPITQNNNRLYLILFLLGVIVISLIRFRLLGIPLERDEGEFAYMGKLLLDGYLPFEKAYNMKLPGTNLMYAIIMSIFGHSYKGIHLGLLFVNAFTMLWLYLGIKRLFNSPIALMTSWTFGIMAVSEKFLGFAAHATHFIAFWVALGILFYSFSNEKKKLYFALLSGFSFGMAFMMKQHALFWVFFGAALFVINLLSSLKTTQNRYDWKALLFCLFGSILPYGILLIIMYSGGLFDQFWFWTVEYARSYTTTVTTIEDAKALFNISFKGMFSSFPLIWILFIIGVLSIWKLPLERSQKWFLYLASIAGILTVIPGFYFRQHYFISLIPAVALVSSATLYYLLSYLSSKNSGYIAVVISALIGFYAIIASQNYYFKKSPKELTRRFYGGNPFEESVEIGKYIKKTTKATDEIAVLGSEPEIYFYSDRLSSTGHIYMYGLMEPQKNNIDMQNQMIQEISVHKPEIIVYVNMKFSWLTRPDSPKNLMDWARDYITKEYQLVGIVDFGPNGPNYLWDNDVKGKQPQTEQHVVVFRRIPTS
ncbi:MAG: glycosyltransferase family 39 protein [Lewinellaceae bacterium]|nr:glycosyltransferase family 39 protein [Lewinellaceae bacterium]